MRSQAPSIWRRAHDLAIEAAVVRSLSEDPGTFGQQQRDALLGLVALPSSVPGRLDALRSALAGDLTRATSGISSVWVDPQFVSPVIAAGAFQLAARLFRDAAPMRPILVPDRSGGVFGLKLAGFAAPAEAPRGRIALCIQATAATALKVLSRPETVLEILSDAEALIDGGEVRIE